MKMLINYISLILTVAIVTNFGMLSSVTERVNSFSDNGARDDLPIVVSMGDSYSSGEGTEPFYDQNLPAEEKVQSQDWLAHRSEQAWAGQLEFNGTQLKDVKDQNWFFVATSGAETIHITDESLPKPYFNGLNYGTGTVSRQISVFSDKEIRNKVDYVTITIGGNDVGFEHIVEIAFKHISVLEPNLLKKALGNALNKYDEEVREKLKSTYERIAEEAGAQAKILVVAYPPLFASNGRNIAIDDDEASNINWHVSILNGRIQSLVRSCQYYDMNIDFIPLNDKNGKCVFEGHEAYTKNRDNEFINGVIIFKQPNDLVQFGIKSCYSVHPNAAGHAAYAECVQRYIKNDYSGIPVRTTTSTDVKDANTILPNPSVPAIDINLKKAYEGYLDILISDEEQICDDDWFNKYYYGGDFLELFQETPKVVGFTDLTGDGIPEMITIASDPDDCEYYLERDNPILTVYTYDPEIDSTKWIMYYEMDTEYCSSDFYFALYKTTDNRLVLFEAPAITFYGGNFITEFEYSDGNMDVSKQIYEIGTDYSHIVVDGFAYAQEECDTFNNVKDEYIASLEFDELLMYNAVFFAYGNGVEEKTRNLDKIELNTYTYSRALLWLKEQLGIVNFGSIGNDYGYAYATLINEFTDNYLGSEEELRYNLIYIDGDDIPELVISKPGYFISLYTYANDHIYILMDEWAYGAAGNHGYYYIPRQNAMYNSNSDYAGLQNWELFMYISDGYFINYKHDMHYQYFPEGVDPWEYENQVDMNVIYYYVDGQEVSEDNYYSYCVPGDYREIRGEYRLDEIFEFFTNDEVPKISYYSVIMSDCTWIEAEEACKAAGGHLATLNDYDEYLLATRAIENSDNPNGIFYIGGSANSRDDIFYLWTSDGSHDYIDYYSSLWCPGEPSHTGLTEDGRTIDELYLCIIPYEDRFDDYVFTEYGFMDVPNDILDAAPSYSGNVGYILEIEK